VQARRHLIDSDAGNKANLETIEQALFCVTLERSTPVSIEDRGSECLLGHRRNARNIWFDKPFHIVTFANGLGGINGEHTWADAMVIVRQQDFVMRSLAADLRERGKPARAPASPSWQRPRKLVWKLDAAALQYIETAQAAIYTLNRTIDIKVLEFASYGKDFIKRYKVTPDFYVQMALQLAYWRLHKEVVATYETGHTRLFFHGRTETVRSTSEESVAFCRAMTEPSATDSERWEKLTAAVAAHGAYVKDAMTGKGIDRHLLGLYIVSQMKGMSTPPPALFTDKGYLTSKKFTLSTSNVSVGQTNVFGGYSPFFKGGYGVCYSLREGALYFNVSAVLGSDVKTDAPALRASIEQALLDMQKLCLTRNIIYVGGAAKL
jgi:carnitine O-acetyltransferase